MFQREQGENAGPEIMIPVPLRRGRTFSEGRPWETIQAFYETRLHNVPCGPLLDLVKAITASPYASLLHATTSMGDLLVFGYSPFDISQERVKIAYEAFSPKKQCLFTYQEQSWGQQPVWSKLCPAHEMKATFERLVVSQLRWVSWEYRRARAKEYEQAGFPSEVGMIL